MECQSKSINFNFIYVQYRHLKTINKERTKHSTHSAFSGSSTTYPPRFSVMPKIDNQMNLRDNQDSCSVITHHYVQKMVTRLDGSSSTSTSSHLELSTANKKQKKNTSF